MRNVYRPIVLALCLLTPGILSAQSEAAEDPFASLLFTPEEIKRAHLELLIRIKNILTPGQQEELLRLRELDSEEQNHV